MPPTTHQVLPHKLQPESQRCMCRRLEWPLPPQGWSRPLHPTLVPQLRAAELGEGRFVTWSSAYAWQHFPHFIRTKQVLLSGICQKGIKTTWDSTYQIMNFSHRFELLTYLSKINHSFIWPPDLKSVDSFQHDRIAHFFCFQKLAWFSLELV